MDRSAVQKLLATAHAAFAAGDHAQLRKLLPELEASGDPAAEDAARDLGRRIGVDPAQVFFLLACTLVLLALVYIYVIR